MGAQGSTEVPWGCPWGRGRHYRKALLQRRGLSPLGLELGQRLHSDLLLPVVCCQRGSCGKDVFLACFTFWRGRRG